jgi:glycopeptide antibiotics resistance protein
MSDFIESNLAFFPLGFLFCSLLPQARASLLALVVSGTFALVIEFGQGFVMGRFSDVTDVLGAILGTLAGSLVVKRGWPAFEAYIRQIGDSQV